MSIIQQKRLINENKIIKNEKNINYVTAYPDDKDILIWYFIIIGQHDTVYNGGQYIGKILLSNNYPLTPPDFVFLTPNGRFNVNSKICLTITGFHKDEWAPSITISGMIIQVYTSFINDSDNGLGHLHLSSLERIKMAKESILYNQTKYNDIYKKFDFTYLHDGTKKITDDSKETIEETKNNKVENIEETKNNKVENIEEIKNNKVKNIEETKNIEEIENIVNDTKKMEIVEMEKEIVIKKRGRPKKNKL